MKKIIICLFVLAFMISISSISFARTMEEEMQAVRDYLNVVDAKLSSAKQAKNTKRVALLHKEKAATLLRWEKLKATMETAKPPVIIRTPTPEPVVVTVPNTKEAGRGVALYLNGGLDAGLTGFSGNLDYDLSGLPAQGLKIRIGGNYIKGTNPTGSDSVEAVSVKLGAIYYVTPFFPDMGLPLTWYIGAAYLLPVKVNNDRTGTANQWGVEAYIGANYNIPELGVINLEVGYSGLKYFESQAALKGMDVKLGYGIIF